MKYIEQRKKTDRIDFHFKPNGVYLGYAYKEVDGYYVFVFSEKIGGAWTDYALGEIADNLTDLNKEWDKQVKTIATEPPVKDEGQEEQNILWQVAMTIIVTKYLNKDITAMTELMKQFHITRK